METKEGADNDPQRTHKSSSRTNKSKSSTCDLSFTGPLAAFLGDRGELSDEMFEEGVGFDGSSIRGFQKIQESGHASRAGQCEIDMRFDTLTSMGDKLLNYKLRT